MPSVIPVNAPAGAGAGSTATATVGGRRYFDDDVIAAPLPYRDGCVERPPGQGSA